MRAVSLWEQLPYVRMRTVSINRSPPGDLDQNSFTAYKSLLIARDLFATNKNVGRNLQWTTIFAPVDVSRRIRRNAS